MSRSFDCSASRGATACKTYGFEVTAIDGKASGGGNVDKVCIRVWNAATGVVVYDNQMNAAPNPAPTTAIVGSIKIKGVRGKGDTDDDN